MFLFLSWLEQQMECFKGKKNLVHTRQARVMPVFLDLKHCISWSTKWSGHLSFHPIFGWKVAHQTRAEAIIYF